ncbi:Pentatricopeptide repeat-containing protein [Acorus calamus]|uniref:Pentatricopeptide repeat-containing protein n=1 Tax=Acorus calamus TaxID=4465 RepID=A0AAV9CJ45_ACOCL|nr:Pentatricopeptide repeat-containing protein [Acorus calamus]
MDGSTLSTVTAGGGVAPPTPRDFSLAIYFAVAFIAVRFVLDAFVYQEPWSRDTKEYFKGWPNQDLKHSVKLFYMCQCGFYIYSIAALLTWETRRKDFAIMMSHHIITTILIGYSYVTGDFETFKRLHTITVTQALLNDEPLVRELIQGYFAFDEPKLAVSVFESIKTPTLGLLNSTLRCLSDHQFHGDLLSLYARTQKSGLRSDGFTFPLVIKACSSLSLLRTAREAHSAVLKSGCADNVFVDAALVDAYAKNDDVAASRRVFDGIHQKDLVCFNSLISGYSSNGFNFEAFELFEQMLTLGFRPNVSTFVTVIPICTRCGAKCIGRSLHGSAVKSGAFSNQSLVSALITMYTAFGDTRIARAMFNALVMKSVVAWNAMISAYTRTGDPDECFGVFRLMMAADVMPNLVTFVSVLPSCGALGFRCAESVHALAIKCGFSRRVHVGTALVAMYSKLGNVEEARRVFRAMPEKNLLSWNSIVSGLVRNGLWDAGFTAFREMRTSPDARPDSVSMVSVLSACARMEDPHLTASVHAFCVKNRLDACVSVSNALLESYADCDRLSISIELFDRMVERDLISWNTLISGHVKNGDVDAAIALFKRMFHTGIKFDVVTAIGILPCFHGDEELALGMSIHGYSIKMGYASDISLANALISMYCSCSSVEDAELLFHCIPSKNLISWNSLLTGYRNNNLYNEAATLFDCMLLENQKPNFVTLLNMSPICETQLQGKSIHAYAIRTGAVSETGLLTSLMRMYNRFERFDLFLAFDEMRRVDVKPDVVTVLALVSACTEIGNLDLAHCVTSYIQRSGFWRSTCIANALTDAYAKLGSISMARAIFEDIEMKDTFSWSVMINGLGIHGDGVAAIDVFERMKSEGVKPDEVTFIGLLSACSHSGLVEEALMLYNSMIEEFDVMPRREHSACMVDLLGRAGRLNEACEIVKGLPFRPLPSMLESLLGACRCHGNVGLGEEIGRWLVESDGCDAGAYVVLSNVYVGAERWGECSRVRFGMDGMGLRKVAGCSVV